MADREKVIKGLECCTRGDACISDCLYCLYFKEISMTDGRCITVLQADALALLKEQEPVEPIRDAISVRTFRCGACGAYVGFIDSYPGDTKEQDNYCRNCGKPVKWDV